MIPKDIIKGLTLLQDASKIYGYCVFRSNETPTETLYDWMPAYMFIDEGAEEAYKNCELLEWDENHVRPYSVETSARAIAEQRLLEVK
jgi:hypothetical protein